MNPLEGITTYSAILSDGCMLVNDTISFKLKKLPPIRATWNIEYKKPPSRGFSFVVPPASILPSRSASPSTCVPKTYIYIKNKKNTSYEKQT